MNRLLPVLLGVAAVCILSGCASSHAGGFMQMRLAEIEEVPGLIEFRNPNRADLNDKMYVEARVLASDRDVEDAAAIRTENDAYVVAVTLSESAARRILRAWSKDLRGRLAVFIDGRPVCTLPMVERFSRHVVVNGNFSRRYAEDVAERLCPAESRAVKTEDLDLPLPVIPRKIDIRENLRSAD